MPLSLISSSTFAFTSLASVSQAAGALSHPTIDVIVLLTLIGGGLFYAFFAGRRKLISSLMLTYMAIAVFPVLPIETLRKITGAGNTPVIPMASFAILFFLLVLFLGARRRGFGHSTSLWQIFLLSFLQVGLLIHIILGFLPPEKINALAPLTRAVFANPSLHVWWLLVPVVVLIFIRHLIHRDE